jgi:hypothetical protein
MALTTGAWIEDEILQSSDPPKHADDMVATMARERIGWGVVNAQYDGNRDALRWLREASTRRGYGAFGVWAQQLTPKELIKRGAEWGAQVLIANPESRAEEAAWLDADLDAVRQAYPAGHAGVCFTESAWGKDSAGQYRKDLAKRWVDRGFIAMPESILSENANASISAMLGVAVAFGFKPELTSVAVYLNKGYPASGYNAEIGLTSGRWNVFRYGDIDPSDWEAIRTWPRPTVVAPPPEPLPTATISEFHAIVLEYHRRLLNKGIVLGSGAYPTLEARLSQAYFQGKALTAAERARVVALFDELKLPQSPV